MKTSLRAKFLLLEVGGILTVRTDDGKPSLLRNYASQIGAEHGRRYKVHYDRARNRCTVTRTA